MLVVFWMFTDEDIKGFGE
jgi:hypothetical protein